MIFCPWAESRIRLSQPAGWAVFERKSMATYETFASVYDAIMDDSLYEKWTDFSLRHFPKDKKKLDRKSVV